MRIMYVEDNQVNLALVERVARMGQHEVISFASGHEALEALQSDPTDIILMDIELEGELDGVEVVKKLRERGDKRPIIAVTAYAMVGDMERILEAGCDEYLPKPIPIAQLLKLLAKYDPTNLSPEPGVSPTPSEQAEPEAAPVVSSSVEAEKPASTTPVSAAAPTPSTQPEPEATPVVPSKTEVEKPASTTPTTTQESAEEEKVAEPTSTQPENSTAKAVTDDKQPVSSATSAPVSNEEKENDTTK